jgi:hypothetical protein
MTGHGESNRGGGGLLLPYKEQEPNVPQHAIDVALAQAALRRLTAQSRARGAAARRSGRPPEKWKGYEYWGIAKAICKDLAGRAWRTMSPGQRKLVMAVLSKEEIARITALHTATAKVCGPGPLPLRPPTRIVRDEED